MGGGRKGRRSQSPEFQRPDPLTSAKCSPMFPNAITHMRHGTGIIYAEGSAADKEHYKLGGRLMPSEQGVHSVLLSFHSIEGLNIASFTCAETVVG